jgi:hypothetical protein
MNQLDLQELNGLTGQALVNVQAIWVTKRKKLVREGLNEMRNYASQEIQAAAHQMLEKGLQIPSETDMAKLVLRDFDFID